MPLFASIAAFLTIKVIFDLNEELKTVKDQLKSKTEQAELEAINAAKRLE